MSEEFNFDPAQVLTLLNWKLPNCDVELDDEAFGQQLRRNAKIAVEKFGAVFGESKIQSD